jgi:hypothetical protein
MLRRSWHLPRERNFYFAYHCADRRHQGCQYVGTGDFGTSPIFRQLSDKSLLASTQSFGVSERKAQRLIEFNATRKRFLWCWRRCPFSRKQGGALGLMHRSKQHLYSITSLARICRVLHGHLRRLIKGPREFRDICADLPKTKS